tara:strand:+ start:80 stop:184 length:105 start_codon:yes stop_codon:yes gene_type:complete
LLVVVELWDQYQQEMLQVAVVLVVLDHHSQLVKN